MTKSSMGAAKMRRTNIRIQHQEHHIRETQARSYSAAARRTAPNSRVNIFVRFYRRLSRWFGGLFSGPDFTSIATLDLTSDRAAGVVWLRQTFSKNLKMISTRDGKPV